MHDDPARDVLLLPFESGALAWPRQGRVWFANARPFAGGAQASRAGIVPVQGQFADDAASAASGLAPLPRAQLRCEQAFKPHADALRAAGYALAGGDERDLPLALVLPHRQRDAARAQLAQALRRLAPGGVLVAAQANDEGARSLQSDLAALCGDVVAHSKRHCRVVHCVATAAAQQSALAGAWAALDAPRALADGWRTRPGVFAWDRIDAASALLVEHLPGNVTGRAADLGAGTGVLAAALLARNPGLAALDLFEADVRALELARDNLAPRAGATALGFHWHDVTAGLEQRYDAIVTNPPFHVGGTDSPDLGRAFIAAAAQALRPGGRLWLVANRHLPYEAALAQGFADVREIGNAHGFKVVLARKADRR